MPDSSRYLVIATAGHIDHGKTALVRALTGIETDRLEEEKRRGITINLGFARLGDSLAIIDVPGHERFIRTMAAGVSTVDLGLLVVAADDGVMPQTREHLAILKLLGVPRLFVALTKISLVDRAWVDLVEEDVRALLPEAYRETTRFFRCDSLSGEGLPELKQALLDLAGETSQRYDSGVFRLPVDRSFSLKGYGTVVAGTILGGRVSVGDRLAVMPSGGEVRVRGLQSQGRDQAHLSVGQRAALNLIGAEAGGVQRGDWICQPGAFLPVDVLSVKLSTLPEAPLLKNRDRVHVNLGTAEILGRVVLFGKDAVEPAGEAFAQLVLESRTVAVRGDRFVIRRYSPVETLGGGVILDPLVSRLRRSDRQTLPLLEALAESNDQEALEIKIRSRGMEGLPWELARVFAAITSAALESMVERLVQSGAVLRLGAGQSALLVSTTAEHEAAAQVSHYLKEYHQRHSDQLGVTRAHLISEMTSSNYPPFNKERQGGIFQKNPLAFIKTELLEYILDDLLKDGRLILEKGYLHLPEHHIRLKPELEALTRALQQRLDEAGLNPPSRESLARQTEASESDFQQAVNTLLLRGTVVRLEDGSLWSKQSLEAAWQVLRREMESGGKTIGQLRDALGCPRRQAVALLEHFDAMGRTLRREDLRVPGPKFSQ